MYYYYVMKLYYSDIVGSVPEGIRIDKIVSLEAEHRLIVQFESSYDPDITATLLKKRYNV